MTDPFTPPPGTAAVSEAGANHILRVLQNKPCPICGDNGGWSIDPTIYAAPAIMAPEGGPRSLGSFGSLLAVAHCTKCFFVRTFAGKHLMEL